MSHPNRGDRKRRSPVTADNLVKVMHDMQRPLAGMDVRDLRDFHETVVAHLSEEDHVVAGAMMRGTLVYLTWMHGEMYMTAPLLSFGVGHLLDLLEDLIAAVDLSKLQSITREALLDDCDRIFGDALDRLPREIVEMLAARGKDVGDNDNDHQ